MADKLFFILVYLKTANLQVVQGALFGMPQPVANRWIHRLLPIVNQVLAAVDELPARTVAEWALDPDQRGRQTLSDRQGQTAQLEAGHPRPGV